MRATPLPEAPPLGGSTCRCPSQRVWGLQAGSLRWREWCAAFWSLATLPSLALQGDGWDLMGRLRPRLLAPAPAGLRRDGVLWAGLPGACGAA